MSKISSNNSFKRSDRQSMFHSIFVWYTPQDKYELIWPILKIRMFVNSVLHINVANNYSCFLSNWSLLDSSSYRNWS